MKDFELHGPVNSSNASTRNASTGAGVSSFTVLNKGSLEYGRT